MPRRPRINAPDAIYHTTARGNRRQPIFLGRRDAELFLGMLLTLRRRRHWRFYGYCLMPNHYHLLLETPDGDLSSGMQWLNGEYAQCFNAAHRTDGHVFQGRFHSVLVESDRQLAELARYLALNPVRAGLTVDARAWRWSSYAALAAGRRSPAFVDAAATLALFGADRQRARAALVDFVEGPSRDWAMSSPAMAGSDPGARRGRGRAPPTRSAPR